MKMVVRKYSAKMYKNSIQFVMYICVRGCGVLYAVCTVLAVSSLNTLTRRRVTCSSTVMKMVVCNIVEDTYKGT